MKEEHQFFADDRTRARADLRVDGRSQNSRELSPPPE